MVHNLVLLDRAGQMVEFLFAYNLVRVANEKQTLSMPLNTLLMR